MGTIRELLVRAQRLLRTKRRLTARLVAKDNARLDRGKTVREERWLRVRIHRVDLLLEREGVL